MDAILDTTAIVHVLRHYQPAVDWLDQLDEICATTAITWLEVMSGATSKAHQTYSKNQLEQFEIIYPTISDYHWAMDQLEAYQFSHRIGISDCLIASIAYRLQIPLYTHNLKHMTPLLGKLAQQPY